MANFIKLTRSTFQKQETVYLNTELIASIEPAYSDDSITLVHTVNSLLPVQETVEQIARLIEKKEILNE